LLLKFGKEDQGQKIAAFGSSYKLDAGMTSSTLITPASG
jgi:hypothetical protein